MEEKRSRVKKTSNILSSLVKGAVYILLFALGLAFSAYLSLVLFQWHLEGGTVTLPDFRNQSLIEAINNSARLGLQVEIRKLEYDPGLPANLIMQQDPPPGKRVRKNSRIWLVVNGGGATVASGGTSGVVVVPDLREKKLEEVEGILRESGLQLGRVVEASHDRIPRGYVISQNPPPQSSVSRGEAINLLVSKGSETALSNVTVRVPDLVGLRLEEAKILLTQEGLSVGTVEEVLVGERRGGIVIDQDPLPGEEVNAGQNVNLRVSKSAQQPAGSGSETLAGTKELRLRFVLPESRVPVEVKVVASDELGERVLYEKTHQGGELVEFSALTRGKGKVVIFLNGYYYWEKSLE